MTHYVGNLVVTAIVHTLHRVHDTTLNGFKSVADMGDCSFQNYVRGVIQEPALVHFVKVMGDPIRHRNIICH